MFITTSNCLWSLDWRQKNTGADEEPSFSTISIDIDFSPELSSFSEKRRRFQAFQCIYIQWTRKYERKKKDWGRGLKNKPVTKNLLFIKKYKRKNVIINVICALLCKYPYCSGYHIRLTRGRSQVRTLAGTFFYLVTKSSEI